MWEQDGLIDQWGRAIRGCNEGEEVTLQLDAERVDESIFFFSGSELRKNKDKQDVIMNNIFNTWKRNKLTAQLHLLYQLSAVHLFLALSASLHASPLAPPSLTSVSLREAGLSSAAAPPDAVKGHSGSKKEAGCEEKKNRRELAKRKSRPQIRRKKRLLDAVKTCVGPRACAHSPSLCRAPLIVVVISPPRDPVSHQSSSSYEYLLKWDTHGEDVGVCFCAEGFSKRPSRRRRGGGG